MRTKLFILLATLFLSTTSAFAISITQPIGDSCDVIAFKNGRIVRAIILSLTSTEIHFKICDEPGNQTYTQEPKNVLSVLYSNGTTATIDIAKDKNGKEIVSDQEIRSNTRATTFGGFALLAAVIGLFFFGLLFGLIGLVLGIIGIAIAEKSRKKGGETLSALGGLFGLIVLCASLLRLQKS